MNNSPDKDKKVPWIEQFKGEESVSKGDIKIEVFTKYYDESNTIALAGAVDPNDPEANVYNQEEVYNALGQRRAKVIDVANDQPAGGQTLWVRVSHDRGHFSPERPIYPQEVKTYYNVYELRLRSALLGHAYRVSEYRIRKA